MPLSMLSAHDMTPWNFDWLNEVVQYSNLDLRIIQIHRIAPKCSGVIGLLASVILLSFMESSLKV